MEETRPPHDGSGTPVQGPHWRTPPDDAPADFTPLRLVLDNGSAAIELDRPDMVAGRHSEADIRLPLPDVSRRHCRFLWSAGRWRVFDLNSLNGLWVNDRIVNQIELHPDDRVRIGGFTFRVELAHQPRDAESAVRSIYGLFGLLRRDPEAPRRLAS